MYPVRDPSQVTPVTRQLRCHRNRNCDCALASACYPTARTIVSAKVSFCGNDWRIFRGIRRFALDHGELSKLTLGCGCLQSETNSSPAAFPCVQGNLQRIRRFLDHFSAFAMPLIRRFYGTYRVSREPVSSNGTGNILRLRG